MARHFALFIVAAVLAMSVTGRSVGSGMETCDEGIGGADSQCVQLIQIKATVIQEPLQANNLAHAAAATAEPIGQKTPAEQERPEEPAAVTEMIEEDPMMDEHTEPIKQLALTDSTNAGQGAAMKESEDGGGELGVLEQTAEESTWQYAPTSADRLGPADWWKGDGNGDCSKDGTQSPVDLDTAWPVENETELVLPNPLVPVVNGSCEKGVLLLNAHTTEVAFDTVCPGQMYVEFPNAGVLKQYNLAQFHYRSPSEHTLNGRYFPMEVQHVHKAADGQALVISVLVGVGEDGGTKADFLRQVQELMPQASMAGQKNLGGNSYEWEQPGALNPYESFLDLSKGYFYYNGSFTTPPCTASTHWVILPEPVMVTQETLDHYRTIINSNPNNQLARFGTITGLGAEATPPFTPLAGTTLRWDSSLGSNNRPVQPMGERKLINVGVTIKSDAAATVALPALLLGLIIGLCR